MHDRFHYIFKEKKLRKTLLIVLACLLCFFIGYFAGSKSRSMSRGFNNPYRVNAKRIIKRNKIPGIQKTIATLNSQLPNKTNTTIPKTKSNAQSKTSSVAKTK